MFRKPLFVILVLLPQFLFAHHGGSEYALNQTVEFKGKLTRVDLINPHSWLYFDVTDKDGKVSHHRCEMRSVHVLRRSGWTADVFRVGQQVTLEVSPNKTDPASCYLQTILYADGTRMDRYGQYVKAASGLQEVRGPLVVPKTNRPLRRPTGEPNISGEWAPEQVVMVNPRGTGGGLVPLSQIRQYDTGESCGRRPWRRSCRTSALWRKRTDGTRYKGCSGFQARGQSALSLRVHKRHL
jgi:Family of unknown function (DUF6152)